MTPVDPIGLSSPALTAAPAQGDDAQRRAAEGFERLLVQRLVEEVAGPALGDKGAAHSHLLPQALTDAMMQAGGIGIAAQLFGGDDRR